MSGVRLREMDSADMVDVIHYIFEEDLMSVATTEHAEARDMYRKTLYGDLYGVPYLYAKSSSKSANNFELIDDPLDEPLDGRDAEESEDLPAYKKPPKPYVPPTNFNPSLVNPFAGSKLDAPLN